MVNNIPEIVMPEGLAGKFKTRMHFSIPLIHRDGEMADRVIKIEYILRRGKNTLHSDFWYRNTGGIFHFAVSSCILFYFNRQVSKHF